jgi:hypothetical protein
VRCKTNSAALLYPYESLTKSYLRWQIKLHIAERGHKIYKPASNANKNTKQEKSEKQQKHALSQNLYGKYGQPSERNRLARLSWALAATIILIILSGSMQKSCASIYVHGLQTWRADE